MAEPIHRVSARAYLITWIALVALTALTFGLAHVPLGDWSLAIALLIAAVKALLVMLIFMHLLEQPGGRRLAMPAGLVFVGLLMTLSLLDVATRWPPSSPPGVQGGGESTRVAPRGAPEGGSAH